MNKSLLIIAHGSRVKNSNNEIVTLTNQIRDQSATDYAHIAHAFLELASPNISDGIGKLVTSGSTYIDIFPYFLVAGNHVISDIPREIEMAKTAYPDITFNLLPYFGASPQIVHLIDQQLSEQTL